MRWDLICALSWWENNVLVSHLLKAPTTRRSQWSNCGRTVYWTRSGWRGASAGESLWMERKSADSLRHTGVAAAPAGSLYLPEKFLFANEWLASHSYPPWGDGVGCPSIYSGSKHKNITDGVTVMLFDRGREGIFFALSVTCMKNTFMYVCFVFCHWSKGSASRQTWQPSWTTGNLTLQRTPLHQMAAMLCSVCVSVHTCRRKTKKRSVCVFYSSVSLVKLQLGVIYSESGGKVTLRLQRTLKYPVLLSHYIVILHLNTRSRTASYPLRSGERGMKRWQGQGFTSHT